MRLCLQTWPPTSTVLRLILSEMLMAERPRDQTRSGRGSPETSHSSTVAPVFSSGLVRAELTILGWTAMSDIDKGGQCETYREQ